MSIFRKSLSVMLAVLIVLQTGAFTVFGESAEDEKQVITISDIDTSQLTGEAGESSTEIEAEGIPEDSLKIVSEEWTAPAEYVISGTNISIRGGTYSYRLVIRSDRTLTFDNDLEIYYQGINGRYQLHYDIDTTDNHTMIVTGTFDNIIISSPLLDKLRASEKEWILTHISKDSYFYQLVLKTKEGFSFINTLRFLIDAWKCGYSVRYSYDLKTDRQTLVICGIPCCDGSEPDPYDGSGEVIIPDDGLPDETPAVPADSEPEDTAAPGGTNDAPQTAVVQPESIRTVVISYGKLRRKARSIKASKVIDPAVRGQGKVTYIKVSGNKKIKIDKKTGRVTVKKGLKKGTYNVTVKLETKGKSSADKKISFAVKVV